MNKAQAKQMMRIARFIIRKFTRAYTKGIMSGMNAACAHYFELPLCMQHYVSQRVFENLDNHLATN